MILDMLSIFPNFLRSYDDREKVFKKMFGNQADYGSFLHLRKLMQRGIAEKKKYFTNCNDFDF